MFNTIVNYFGYTFYPIVILFLIAYLVLLVKRNRTETNLSVLIASGFFVLLFPVLYFVCNKIGQGAECYRFFWLFPLNIILGFLVVSLWKHENYDKETGVILLIAIVGFCGNVLFANDISLVAENIYEIPEEMIEICDDINADCLGREVRVVGESEVMICIRQYSSNLCWGYTGRGQMVQADEDEFSSMYIDDTQYRVAMAIGQNQYIDGTDFYDDLKTMDTDYLVVLKDNEVTNRLYENAFDKLYSTEHYEIYKIK